MITSQIFTLAQAAAEPAQPWWHVLIQGSFGLTVIFIFISAVIGVIVTQRKRDKCLKLMHDYHVSYINNKGEAMWGDLFVFSSGLEINYDKIHETRDGLLKASSLIYDIDLVNCSAICRVNSAQSAKENSAREKQIKRTFSPGLLRQCIRGFRNILNTLKDAFSKAFSLLLGQLSKASPQNALTGQQGNMDQIGQMVLGAAGNAYEPLLEKHIGRPVIMQTRFKSGDQEIITELPGFLADYTDKYVALFNRQHQPIKTQEVEVTDTHTSTYFAICRNENSIQVTATSTDLIVINWLQTSKRIINLQITLTPGSSVDLPHDNSQSVKFSIDQTRRVDIVCPRSNAVVYFGGDRTCVTPTTKDGSAPESIAELPIE
ncbi:hypothetical protein KS4_19060 [Poriferisphaera corsica]|uniref:Uncharacterized protein n=1 Tax=Poriferisphaera corsica TaxID=2528020 RepID=A0A517YUH5_9BACT|nr:hypothetical protein [Poriferisphaera corsica]QDU33847.1 hypothetical protein KS4_19060 [Poriferisphaera corsica]